ncbi:MAG: hypothetical protein H0Z33_05420 [Bacillaceae bacterium]|nr:hypothetical protein [Bacillaceae bacterium]
MKKSIIGVVIGFLLAIPLTTSAYYYQTIQVERWNLKFQFDADRVIESQTFFNGKTTVPTSFIYNGTTYVPLRFVAEHSRTAISWDEREQKISFHNMVLKPEEKKTVSFYFDRSYRTFQVTLPKGYKRLSVTVNRIQYDAETIKLFEQRGTPLDNIGVQALVNRSNLQNPFYSNRIKKGQTFIITNPNQYLDSFYVHFGNGDAVGRVDIQLQALN